MISRRSEAIGFHSSLRTAMLQPTARLYLLWVLVEDSLRKEVNYSMPVADRWARNLRWIGRGVQPLSQIVRRVATIPASKEVITLERGIRFVAREMKLAAERITETSFVPATRFYYALGTVRQARLALAVLLNRIAPASQVDSQLSTWTTADLDEIRQSGSPLQKSLDSFITVCDGDDASSQCLYSRQLFLALYWAAAFDESQVSEYYEPTLQGHQVLVDRMPLSTTRECVRQRLEILRRIPPGDFNTAALRIALTRVNWASHLNVDAGRANT